MPPTSGNAGGVWPTPTLKGNYNKRGTSDKSGDGIETAVKEWPTPRASVPCSRPNGKGGKVLNEEVEIAEGVRERGQPKWPTPRVSDSGGGVAKDTQIKDGKFFRKNKAGVLYGVNLRDAVPAAGKEWPTPMASDWKGVGPLGSKSHVYRYDRKYLDATVQEVHQQSGTLNPDWVEWLMQWPIGWTSLEPMPRENFEAWLQMVGDGTWFDEDPGDTGEVPRLAPTKPLRKQRLMALGNGWVPCQALMAEATLWHLRP